jgi:endonuclease VIII
VPEGDALHRAARRLQPLVGQRLEVESPNPRAQASQVAPRVDGRVLESVEAVGKNLLLRFEGGLVVRSHLRMTGRWRIEPRGKSRTGLPWLVLRGETLEGVLWNGPVLTLETRNLRRLGQDVLADEFDVDAAIARLRGAGALWLGEALQDQRLVAGIGNMWMAEALWSIRVSPWVRVRDVDDAVLRDAVAAARRLMGDSLATGRQGRRVYRRAGRPCPRCGTIVRSRGQGDENRTAYWCPSCQEAGGETPGE